MSLDTQYQQFIHISRYARWLEQEGRREQSWEETADRYVNYITDAVARHNNYELPADVREEIRKQIHDVNVLPSMRGVMTAGPALERDNTCLYNCSYLPVDSLRSFDEAMYILLCGTGVGYSVESQYVGHIPAVNEHFERTGTVIHVADSKAGWARGLRELLALLWSGQIPSWDTSAVRPAGARLKTFGGRASGPEPLERLFTFTVDLVTKAAGRKITPLEAHDLMCKIAEVVVVGGVRRSAMISLNDLDDHKMATAKSGNWWENNGQRALANVSAIYQGRPDPSTFMAEWKNIYDSKSGERGIFNREAARQIAAKNGRRDTSYLFGTNPCAEIILRPFGFCNLTEVVVREDDTLDTLVEKVRLASILGTIQASFTRFKYLRRIWKKNAEEEALLGVSLTGQLGHMVLSGRKGMDELADWLETMRDAAIEANAEYAALLGINPAAAITTGKPSGTVSQLANCASGGHAWHNDYYIRTVRGDNKDPLTKFLTEIGVPAEPDVMKPADTTVFSFPVKAPEGALTRNDLTAIEHLNLWLAYQRHWCEHKPSVTISIREHEWLEVGAWVYEHFDEVSGISFLPYSEHIYKQAPYQDCTREQYEELAAKMPEIDWSDLRFYEFADSTSGSQELSCVAGECEIVDIGGAE